MGIGVTYTLNITNTGPGVATFLKLSNNLPANVSLISFGASTGTVSQAPGAVLWSLPQLNAGSSANVFFTILHAEPGWHTNHAVIMAYEQDPNFANNVSILKSYVQLSPASGTNELYTLNFAIEDMVYDSSRNHLLLSMRDAGGTNKNGIAAFNPETALLESFSTLGQTPSRIAISDDDQFLYVSLPNSARVRRLELNALDTVQEFALGGESIYDRWYPYYATEMAVAPGNPLALVVSRMRQAGPLAGEYATGVALFTNGIILTNVTAGGPYFLEFDDDARILYASDSGSINRCITDASGVSLSDQLILSPGVSGEVEYGGGRLFNTSGRAIGLESFAVEGIYPGSERAILVEPDELNHCVWFLGQNGSEWRLNGYDMDSYDYLASLIITNLQGTPRSLIRWGTNGLAFRTSSNQLFLVRFNIPGTDVQADIGITQRSPANAVPVGTNMVFTLTMTNHGPATAHNLVLTNFYPSHVTIVAATATDGNFSSNKNTLACTIPTLASGSAVTVRVTVRTAQGGLLTSSATATSLTPDSHPGNNTCMATTQVEAQSGGATIIQLTSRSRFDLVARSRKNTCDGFKRALLEQQHNFGKSEIWRNCLRSLCWCWRQRDGMERGQAKVICRNQFCSSGHGHAFLQPGLSIRTGPFRRGTKSR